VMGVSECDVCLLPRWRVVIVLLQEVVDHLSQTLHAELANESWEVAPKLGLGVASLLQMEIQLMDQCAGRSSDYLQGLTKFLCQVEVLGICDALEAKHEESPCLDHQLLPGKPSVSVVIALKQVSVDFSSG
jgi:hypothetical protein